MHDVAYPAIDRLRSELIAARQGVRELAVLDGRTRERVEAELRSAIPDLAGWASREAGCVAVVAVIRRTAAEQAEQAGVDDPASGAVWDSVLATAIEAATAVSATSPLDTASAVVVDEGRPVRT